MTKCPKCGEEMNYIDNDADRGEIDLPDKYVCYKCKFSICCYKIDEYIKLQQLPPDAKCINCGNGVAYVICLKDYSHNRIKEFNDKCIKFDKKKKNHSIYDRYEKLAELYLKTVAIIKENSIHFQLGNLIVSSREELEELLDKDDDVQKNHN